jgi:hypothetical protein
MVQKSFFLFSGYCIKEMTRTLVRGCTVHVQYVILYNLQYRTVQYCTYSIQYNVLMLPEFLTLDKGVYRYLIKRICRPCKLSMIIGKTFAAIARL